MGAGLSWGPGDGGCPRGCVSVGGANPDLQLFRSCFSLRKRGYSSPLLCLLLPAALPPRDAALGQGPGRGALLLPGAVGGEMGQCLGPWGPRAVRRAEAGRAAPKKALQSPPGRYRRVSSPGRWGRGWGEGGAHRGEAWRQSGAARRSPALDRNWAVHNEQLFDVLQPTTKIFRLPSPNFLPYFWREIAFVA